MKKHLVLLLALSLLMTLLSASAEEPAIYTGQSRLDLRILAEQSTEAASLGVVPKNRTMDILEVEPYWAKIRYNGTTGYIRRSSIIDTTVKTVSPATTPPYSTVECDWLAWVSGDAPILTAPQADAEVLITMHDGARLALLDIEDGWGRLIYHRQYAYINTNALREIQPINKTYESGSDAPLAAYTSFYRITTDETNLGRMENIAVANERMRRFVMGHNEEFDFNRDAGPYNARAGYLPANVLVDGETILGYGGGTCQVSSTLYNALMQLPGLHILKRRPHGPSGASYLPLHADAAVGNKNLNLVFRNLYPFPVRIDGSAQDGALTIAIWKVLE